MSIKEIIMTNKLLSELLETSANACDAFIKSEIALNDGDLTTSQKSSKNGQTLMKALILDTFNEVEEALGENLQETFDYDYANVLELIRSLNEISMYVGAYIEAEGEVIKNIAIKNLFKAINTSKEIYLALFEN